MSDSIIRLAQMADKDEVVKLYDDLNDFMAVNINYNGWQKNIYPKEQTALDGLCENALYVLEIDGRIAGTVILNSNQPETYAKASWSIKADAHEVLVIHTLAIHPDFQGRGIATKLVAFADTLAKERHMKAIRLDTSAKNTPASNLYEKTGYRLAGLVDLELGELSLHKMFKCYEKEVV